MKRAALPSAACLNTNPDNESFSAGSQLSGSRDEREASALMQIIIQTRTRINLWDLTESEGGGLQLHIIVPPRENTTVLIAKFHL